MEAHEIVKVWELAASVHAFSALGRALVAFTAPVCLVSWPFFPLFFLRTGSSDVCCQGLCCYATELTAETIADAKKETEAVRESSLFVCSFSFFSFFPCLSVLSSCLARKRRLSPRTRQASIWWVSGAKRATEPTLLFG